MTVIFPKGVRNLLRHIYGFFFNVIYTYQLSKSTSKIIPSNLNCVAPDKRFHLVVIASVLHCFAPTQITCVLSKLVFNPGMFAKVSSSCNVSSREVFDPSRKARHHLYILKNFRSTL